MQMSLAPAVVLNARNPEPNPRAAPVGIFVVFVTSRMGVADVPAYILNLAELADASTSMSAVYGILSASVTVVALVVVVELLEVFADATPPTMSKYAPSTVVSALVRESVYPIKIRRSASAVQRLN